MIQQIIRDKLTEVKLLDSQLRREEISNILKDIFLVMLFQRFHHLLLILLENLLIK
jgi:membrane-associated HD superfamily phosphohydrolase